MNLDLQGKTALVCGASQGIGAATAYELASLGCRVVAIARSQDKLETLVHQLNQKFATPQGHQYLSLDLEKLEQLNSRLQGWLDQNGFVNILVCNSGGPAGGSLADAQDEVFQKAFVAHVLANQNMVKLVLPGMRQSQYGRIINVISTSVKTPIPNLGVSNTIRAAVANWAKSLAQEVGEHGITVNNVLPGYTLTPRLDTLLDKTAQSTGQTRHDVELAWQKSVPLRRFALPQETAAAIAFLASPSAAYIHGINLPVDGGRTPCL